MTAGRTQRPKQARSRETERRILDAASAVVAARGTEGASVAAIAAAAGTSVGNVYRRFPNKDALLRAMEAELFRGRAQFWAETLDARRWEGRSLREFVGVLAAEIVGRHRAQQGLLRALATRARAEYEARAQPAGKPWHSVIALMRAQWGDEIPGGVRAIALALEMMAATAGELILFREEAAAAHGLNDDVLATELTTMAVAYMTAER